MFNQRLTDMWRTQVNRMLAVKEVSLCSRMPALVVEACEFKNNGDGSRNRNEAYPSSFGPTLGSDKGGRLG
jgi:hypothetical protein